MIKEENKKISKIFIEETIGSRKYLSYRVDLMLYKTLLSILMFLVIYIITLNITVSILVGVQVFFIFTLVNKLRLERKSTDGKNLLMKKVKAAYFEEKIREIDSCQFEYFVQYLLEKKNYSNFVKENKYTYRCKEQNNEVLVKIFKLYEGAEIEKLDVRSFILRMYNTSINKGLLITTDTMSEEAKNLIDKAKNNIDIEVIDLQKLYQWTDEYNLLPEEETFYNKICKEKVAIKKRNILKQNAIDSKKIFMYIIAALFFYTTSKLMPYNTVGIYISYYFVLLTLFSLGCLVQKKIAK